MGGFHRALTWMLSDIEAFSFPMSYQAETPSILSGTELEQISDDFQGDRRKKDALHLG
jgi:hypothetical protein